MNKTNKQQQHNNNNNADDLAESKTKKTTNMARKYAVQKQSTMFSQAFHRWQRGPNLPILWRPPYVVYPLPFLVAYKFQP